MSVTTGTDHPRSKAPLAWIAGAAAVGAAVTVVGELLVGDASGGGPQGARAVAEMVAIGAALALLAVGLVALAGGRRTATVCLTVLTCLALLVAWYSAMPFVLGAAAYALSRPGTPAVRRTGAVAGVLGTLGLLLFVVLVTRELLLT